ncbi:MAG: HAD hydrolase family protein, partial [Clostridiaceae bacterium]|nr:HAD hydrolase family protein [Clostridiaceae bacterium]
MGKPRMVVTDLDGTLLRDDKTLSEATLQVLRRLRRERILF